MSEVSRILSPVFSFLHLISATSGFVLVTLQMSVVDPPRMTREEEATTSTSGGTIKIVNGPCITIVSWLSEPKSKNNCVGASKALPSVYLTWTIKVYTVYIITTNKGSYTSLYSNTYVIVK